MRRVSEAEIFPHAQNRAPESGQGFRIEAVRLYRKHFSDGLGGCLTDSPHNHLNPDFTI
jgi:hypothetical protein